MIWIRADANREIGTGHVMRCLSIAAALKKLGQQVCFLTADQGAAALLQAKGQAYRVLDSDYRNLEGELAILERIFAEERHCFTMESTQCQGGEPCRESGSCQGSEPCQESRPCQGSEPCQKSRPCQGDGPCQRGESYRESGSCQGSEPCQESGSYQGSEPCRESHSVQRDEDYRKGRPAADFFLADSYFVTADYFRKVREWMPVGCLDDKYLTGLPLDMLINYNIFAEASSYGETDARLLLGTEYAPLREEFINVPYNIREKASRVLVTTGGSDRYGLAGRFVEKALADARTAALEYRIVSGVYNVHLEELLALEKNHPNVKICSNVPHMHRLMLESDMAVTAGGSTMYELSAVGVPMACFSFVDNQERIVEGFARRGLVCFGGNYLTQGESMLDGAVDGIARLATDAGLRAEYSRKLKDLVDGQGAMRIAQQIAGQIAHT